MPEMVAMPAALPEATELATTLREVVVPTGLVIADLQEELQRLSPLTGLAVVRDHLSDSDPQAAARAIRDVIIRGVERLEGDSRAATELLLGVGSTRGQSRAQRRHRAAEKLGKNVDYFKRTLELRLLSMLADEVINLECVHHATKPEVVAAKTSPRPFGGPRRAGVAAVLGMLLAAVVLVAVRAGSSPSDTLTVADVTVTNPQAGATVTCRLMVVIYRCAVAGHVVALADNEELLLWVRPIQPPSERAGWYLQRPPFNGVDAIDHDGSWRGTIQIGNADFPPHSGDLLDLAVTVVTQDSAEELRTRPEVVVELQPVGRGIVTVGRVRVALASLD